MRKGRFPPFGSVLLEFGLRKLVLVLVLDVFDFCVGRMSRFAAPYGRSSPRYLLYWLAGWHAVYRRTHLM